MCTNCVLMVANLFLFCYDSMMFLSDFKQTDYSDAFYTKPRYLDNILNINTRDDPKVLIVTL